MKKLAFTMAAIVVILLFAFITARAAAPTGITYDPADQGYCEAYGIKIDSTQVEAVYLHPETILADPESFLSNDSASLHLDNRHVEVNDPLDVEGWVQQIERIESLSMDERERQTPYAFARDVIAGKETFCKIAVPHILSYLPEEAEISTTYYLAALDPINTGFYHRGGILIGLSHPMYAYSNRILDQGSAPIFNIMVHELFHKGYEDAWLWQVEDPLENGALRTLLRTLQNDGLAVNAAYRVTGYYPSSLDFAYPLHDFKPYVRYLIGQVNQVLENAGSKSAGDLYQDVSRLHRRNVHYIVGGYMAGRIEDQLGRESLVATVATGPIAFVRAYNSVAEDGMELHFVEPQYQDRSAYRDLRKAALERNLAGVRENLEAIRTNPLAGLDLEAEGYLIYNAGYILLRDGHLDLAEDVFQLDIALFPQVGAIYVGLGDVYVRQGDISAAIENYRQAMVLDPRNIWVAEILLQLELEEQ
jgi:tetratricopeptide (TPR) repeat protein